MIWLLAYCLAVYCKATGDAYMHLDRQTFGKRYLAMEHLILIILPSLVAVGYLPIRGNWWNLLAVPFSYVCLRYFAFDLIWNWKAFGYVSAYLGVTGDYAKIMNRIPGVIVGMTKWMAGFAAITYLIFYQ